ncbi:uncharacterized protein LOC113515670 [Galleria mellonella]|uniref:Uncharacterized protein LOC113515670 n=1 Tax=Galleria mellonella TaxID=7137 RepID=A0ABM3MX29_GALME|nr:uncharacterized protein LOC113515670 [Galleria mellonella]
MPNARRRRFSVQNDIAQRDPSKMQNASPNRYQNPNTDGANHNVGGMKISSTKNKSFPYSFKNNNTLEIVAECDSNKSLLKVSTVNKKHSSIIMDKDVTASSSNIDLMTNTHAKLSMINTDNETKPEIYNKIINSDESKKRNGRTLHRDITPLRRDKHPRQHRIKVRSPKRRMSMPDKMHNNDVNNNKRSIGTIVMDWNQEVIEVVEQLAETSDESRLSDNSLDGMCRICHGGGALSSELG